MTIKSISSITNPLIKEIIALQTKSRERKQSKRIVIEGAKEMELAIESGIKFIKILYNTEIINKEELFQLLLTADYDKSEIYAITQAVFSKIAYRESTGGIIAIAETPERKLNDLPIKENSVYIILENVEKPGNLGAICRVADAAKVDGLIICDPHTDIYNPNAIRSSLGCVFTVNVVNSTFDETIAWLRENKITSYATSLNSSEWYQDYDLTGKAAFVFGTESTGLTDKWINGADKRIKIPMRGIIDSLNVNTSVAIIVFEAMRQRNFQD